MEADKKRRDLDLSLPEGPPELPQQRVDASGRPSRLQEPAAVSLPAVPSADAAKADKPTPETDKQRKIGLVIMGDDPEDVGLEMSDLEDWLAAAVRDRRAAKARQQSSPAPASPADAVRVDGPTKAAQRQLDEVAEVLRGHRAEDRGTPQPLPEPPSPLTGSDAPLQSSGARGPSLFSRLQAANADSQRERDEFVRARDESLQKGPTITESAEPEAGSTGWFGKRIPDYAGDWPLAEQGTIPSAAVQQEAGNRRVAPPMLSPPAYGEENLSAPATARDDDEDWLRSGPSAEPASASQHALPPDSGTPEPVGRSGQAPSTQARSGPLAPPVRQETSPAASISLIHQIAAELREEGTFSRDLNGPEVAGIMSGVIESLVSVPEEKQGEVTIGGVDNLVVSIKRRQGTVTAGVKVTKPNIPVKIPVKCVLGNSETPGRLRLVNLSIGSVLTKIALKSLGKVLGVDVEAEARRQLSNPNQALTQALTMQLSPLGIRITKAEMGFSDDALSIELNGGPI